MVPTLQPQTKKVKNTPTGQAKEDLSNTKAYGWNLNTSSLSQTSIIECSILCETSAELIDLETRGKDYKEATKKDSPKWLKSEESGEQDRTYNIQLLRKKNMFYKLLKKIKEDAHELRKIVEGL